MIKLEVNENAVQGMAEGRDDEILAELAIRTVSILEKVSKGTRIDLDVLIDMYTTVMKDPESIKMFKKETSDVPTKSKVVIKRKGGKK